MIVLKSGEIFQHTLVTYVGTLIHKDTLIHSILMNNTILIINHKAQLNLLSFHLFSPQREQTIIKDLQFRSSFKNPTITIISTFQ